MPLRALVLAITIFAFVASFALDVSAAGHLTGRRVCLDPGHGGSDPGAVYAGMQEKDLTLDIAQRLAALLTADGAVVTLTRTGDVALGNSERAAICNSAGAEVVLSIHLNASRDPSVDYFQAFYGKLLKDREFALTIDRNYQLLNPAGTAPLPHRSVTNFANGTLLRSKAPASLAETVFLSNPEEQQVLLAGTRQPQIASELYKGVAAWFSTR